MKEFIYITNDEAFWFLIWWWIGVVKWTSFLYSYFIPTPFCFPSGRHDSYFLISLSLCVREFKIQRQSWDFLLFSKITKTPQLPSSFSPFSWLTYFLYYILDLTIDSFQCDECLQKSFSDHTKTYTPCNNLQLLLFV